MMRRFRTLLAVVSLLFSVTAIPLSAQNANAGDIRGVVTDPTGAVIPGAIVTVLDKDKGVTTTYTTDGSGLFDTGPIVTDSYQVTIAKEGFISFVRSQITLQVGIISVNAQLKPGATATSVVVTDDVPLIQTESGEQSTTLEAKVMAKLPNSTPDWQNFVKLIPGATATSTSGTTNTGQAFSVNGNLPYNAVLADGASSALSHSGNADVSTFETVQEVQINTSAFSAQYGTGGVIFNQISKGGSKQFHGALYEYAQNDFMNARSYYQTTTPYKRFHNFGGSIGGPIFLPSALGGRNRLFIYFNYDQQISLSATTGYSTVPTDAVRAGNFAGMAPVYDPSTTSLVTVSGKTYIKRNQFLNNQVPVSAAASKILALFPRANYSGSNSSTSPTTGITANNYYYNLRGTQPFKRFFGRFDYDISPTNRLTGSVTERDNPAHYVGAPGCPITCVMGDVSSYNSQLTDVWNISSRTINEVRLGYTNQMNFFIQDTQDKGVGTSLGLPYLKYDIIPTLNITSYTGIGQPLSPFIYKEHNFDPSDVVTMIRGKHVLHFGGEYMIFQDNSTIYGNINGSTLGFTGVYTQCTYCQTSVGGGLASTGNAWADLFTESIQSWSAQVTPEFGGRQKAPQMFIQDDWKLSPNLTVNLGLRYQIMEGWSDTKGNQRTFDPLVTNSTTGTLGGMWYATTKVHGRSQLQNNVYDTFLPRVGFAYQYRPGFVIRGGYGLYAYLWSLDTYGGDEGTAFGFKGSLADTTNGVTPVGKLSGTNPQFPYIGPTTDSGAYNGQGVNFTNQQTPVTKIHQYNLTVEQQIGTNMKASIAFVGSRSVHLNFARDINQVPAAYLSVSDQQFRPYPQFTTINGSTFNADANYNSLQATLQKRLTRGFSFDASYVWSKFLDEFDSSAWGSRNGTTSYQSSYDVGANYGPSNFDVRNAFKGDAIYVLPFGRGQRFLSNNYLLDEALGGWQLSTTYVLQSGNPFTITVPTTLAQSYAGSGNLYPNWASNPTLANQTRDHWFNTTYIGQNGAKVGSDTVAAYAIPQNGAFGNFHRNNVYGPGMVSFNTSLGKTFNLYKEQYKFELRADATNVLNHPVFANPNGSVSNGNFGKITGTNLFVGGRAIQLVGRFSF
jgi:hypothetical protein